MIVHILINLMTTPGMDDRYIALCGYIGREAQQFHDSTKTALRDKRVVTCQKCLEMMKS